jgi:hypothetical protein
LGLRALQNFMVSDFACLGYYVLEGSILLRKPLGFRSLDLYIRLACVGRRVWAWFVLACRACTTITKKEQIRLGLHWQETGWDRKHGVLAKLLVELCARIFAGGKRVLAEAVEYIIFLVLLVPTYL